MNKVGGETVANFGSPPLQEAPEVPGSSLWRNSSRASFHVAAWKKELVLAVPTIRAHTTQIVLEPIGFAKKGTQSRYSVSFL